MQQNLIVSYQISALPEGSPLPLSSCENLIAQCGYDIMSGVILGARAVSPKVREVPGHATRVHSTFVIG